MNNFPDEINIKLKKVSGLRYGENPHQSAARYIIDSDYEYLKSVYDLSFPGGKEMSFNNYYDLNAALAIANDFDYPVCAILKHGNICGIAGSQCTGNQDAGLIVEEAIKCDKESAFGGVMIANRPFNEYGIRQIIYEQLFLELLIYPHNEHSEELNKRLRKEMKGGKNLRIIDAKLLSHKPKIEIKQFAGEIFIQELDHSPINEGNLLDYITVATGHPPSYRQRRTIVFAIKTIKHLKSNAVALFDSYVFYADKNSWIADLKILGAGYGDVSRIGATKRAIEQAGHKLSYSTVLMSDGFFPFADSINSLRDSGIKYVVAPNGSIRDQEVIEAAKNQGINLYFCNQRFFKH